jgi:hypothetical protein
VEAAGQTRCMTSPNIRVSEKSSSEAGTFNSKQIVPLEVEEDAQFIVHTTCFSSIGYVYRHGLQILKHILQNHRIISCTAQPVKEEVDSALIGCFRDESTRAVDGAVNYGTHMTNQFCIEHCAKQVTRHGHPP